MSAPQIPFADSDSLPRLSFAVEGAEPVRFAAAPTVGFSLRLESDKPVRSLVLNVQIRILPARRVYDAGEQERLVELFGEPSRWGETLRTFVWTNGTVPVPPFAGSTVVEVPVACTYDLEVASAKYFHGLGEGEVPLEFLFSGTVFYAGRDGLLQTVQIPWECEAQFRLPVRVWREAMEQHFPGSAWLRLRKDVFDRLVAHKARRAFPTWEETVSDLLEGRE